MSKKSRKARNRRKRRQEKDFLKNGSKPRHKSKSGRTGKIQSTKNKSLNDRAQRKKK